MWFNMSQTIEIETGAQLLARLTERPTLQGLENVLFSNGPLHNQVIEISGDSASGKTLLMTRLIAKCLLPTRFRDIGLNGSGVGVVLINTDHHFHISALINSMAFIIRSKISAAKVLSDDIVKQIIEDSLGYLTVINCYESGQYIMALESLRTLLSNDNKIAMIAVDSMSSYYWQDRENGGAWSMDEYLKNRVKLARNYVFRHKVVLLYTRPGDFESRSKAPANYSSVQEDEKVHYRVRLHRWEDTNEFSASVETGSNKKTFGYTISNNGIDWKTVNDKN